MERNGTRGGGRRGRGRGRGGRGRGPPNCSTFSTDRRGGSAPRGGNNTNGETAISLDESFCMEIHALLQALVEDGTRSEMSFPSSYDNTQRRYIHSMAQKYGLFSKSSGKKGAGRFIHVAKVKKNAAMQQVSLRLPAVSLNASTAEWFPPIVTQYMERYPAPGKDGALLDPWSARDLSPLASVPKRQQTRGGAPLFKPLPSRSKETDPKTLRTPPVEATKLPVYGYRQQILELVERNQIVVLSGDTGCGKSTQIPQFLLDNALAQGRGQETRIICTQPRRISAISLAERVARERSGPRGEDSKEVGHAIRFDSSFDAKRSKLIFCTTGTLLKWLNNDPLARGFSHIILDEVHERDQFTDFLLILIKTSILKQRPDLKVILMSATIQVEKFSQYFQPDFPAPVLQMVGGTNFPVTTLFLEDILALLERDRSSPLPIMDDSRVGRVGDASGSNNGGGMAAATCGLECPLCGGTGFADEEAFGMHVATCFGDPSADFGMPPTPEPEITPIAIPVAAMGDVLQGALGEVDGTTKEALLLSYMKQQDALRRDQAVDYDLLLQLLFLVNRTFPLDEDGKGAILVFLPGWEEISFMERALLNSPATTATYEIALLHSRLSAQEQRRAFMTPPHGKRKLVLATNIAETSLTIEDVVFVVDCGKSKQTHALAATSSSSFVMGLQTTWVARANCVQRTGRAGRVRAGICFRLFSKARYETAMKQFMLPELLTTPLEELLLQIKLLQFEKKLHIRDAKKFLLEAMDAPSETSIDASLQRLEDMRALTTKGRDHQALTLLGWHLGHICTGGVAVQMAKLLLWGHTFGCFDAILQTTCTLSGYRDPFISFLGMSPEEQRQVDASKKAFARNGSPPALPLQSDHFVLWKAFEAYLDARARGSFKAKDAFCARNKLHRQTLEQLVSIYKQLQQDMESIGLSPATQLVPAAVPKTPATMESVTPYLMALSIGMFPNALFTRSGGVSRNWTSKEKVKVKIDGASMVTWAAANSQKHKKKHGSEPDEIGPPDEWLVYHEMMQSERTRVAKYGTKLPSFLLQALLMGSVETQTVEEQEADVEVNADGSIVTSKWLLVLDDWVVFELSSAHEARWIALLRERLHATFIRHLERLHANTQQSGTRTLSEVDQQLRQHDAELLHALVAWVSSDLRRGSRR
ncbi:DExH-box ATP-dependent RNA helicase DExH2 [Phytophthora ramorum]|uniref:DExH-box ATP-dependent RNA helicase DExH2 n=1 Tax=Phytophthora ramorum TaxID=164328 RepID=UPI0030ABF27A|nr:DExH-box ATP-dependent RNA helicase DExH2 [Phytophthora ramorum]